MTIPHKKLKSGFSLPVFGFGTWRFGGDFRRDLNNNDAEQIDALKTAINYGITHIDTAERYAAGFAEQLVSKAIFGFDRKKLFIVSKVWPTNFRYDDVLRSAHNSLKRLKVSYLDLYLLHKPDLSIPIRQTMKAMDKLKEDGLIKNIGVSNFSVNSFKSAQSLTRNKIVVNQVHYNLIFREPEKSGLLDYCRKNDVLLIAWRPVEKGILSVKGIKIIDEVCRKYNKTAAQIAINWLISQKNVVTLAKMVSQKHLHENLGALNWQMDNSDIEKLRRSFPGQKSVSAAVPLG